MIETRKFNEYDELKWFLWAYSSQFEIIELKELKRHYKLKIKWL